MTDAAATASAVSTIGKLIGANYSHRAIPDIRGHTMRVLFVCLGNICRSPSAEGVFRQLLAEREPALAVEIDSAGTHGYHVGAPPDRRAIEAASRRGIDLAGLRARQVSEQDFARFDFILAMDRANLRELQRRAPGEYHGRIRLLMEFAAGAEILEVPDPYYGGAKGFEEVLDLLEEAAAGLLQEIRLRTGGDEVTVS